MSSNQREPEDGDKLHPDEEIAASQDDAEREQQAQEDQEQDERNNTDKMLAIRKKKQSTDENPAVGPVAETPALHAPEQSNELPDNGDDAQRPAHGVDEIDTVSFRGPTSSPGDWEPTVAFAPPAEINDWQAGVSNERYNGRREPVSAVPYTPPLLKNNDTFANDYSPISDDPMRWQRHRKAMLHYISRKHMRDVRGVKHQTARRIWISVFSTLLALLVVFLSLSGASSYVAYQFYNNTQSQFTNQIINLPSLLPKDNLKIYDSKGVLLYQAVDQGMHTTITFKQVPQSMVNAVVSAEDKNFWTDPGFDPARILQSALVDLSHHSAVQGGSTITQQLIKKLVVGDKSDLQRKLQEVSLTPIINQHYTKPEILTMYLNTVFYGENAYGIDAAANAFFDLHDQPNKPAVSQLDLAQSAMLAGLIDGPSIYDPFLAPQLASARFDYVINRMVVNKYITSAQAQSAEREAQGKHFFKHPTNLNNLAPHFVYFVMQQLEDAFHLKGTQLSRSDMQVHTTLDLKLQNKIQKIAQAAIAAIPAYQHVTNASVVLIDPHTGAVKTLLGSINYYDKAIGGQFDVATDGFRQPGSSFKPYVYATAFENGVSPAQAIADTPITINIPGSEPYTPKNYDFMYHGNVTVRCALQTSLNIPAVKTLQHVGIAASMKTAEAMGLGQYNGTPTASLVLGSLGIHLIDHTSAYGTFANGGVHVPYYTIQKVNFANDQQHTYNHPTNTGKRVLSPQIAYMMSSVLSDDASRIHEFGNCDPLQLFSNPQGECFAGNPGTVRPAAAKTGTSNNFTDNLTVGYTPDYVMGVWAGNNDGTPMGAGVTGIVGAAPIWHDSMLVAEQGRPMRNFQNPGGLVQQSMTYSDGVHSTDWFLPNAVPNVGLPPIGNQPGNAMIKQNSNKMARYDLAAKDPAPGIKPGAPASKPMPAWCPTYNYAPPSLGAPPAW